MSPHAKAGPRPTGLSWRENLQNHFHGGKQMTTKPLIGAPSAHFWTWKSIQWPQVEKQVKRLQMRIAKATREGRQGKAKSLQWLLTHSFYGKLMAVKRVTSNKGAKTPGIDGVIWKTPNQKMEAAQSLRRRGYQPQPLRRIYIPKSNGKKRLLGTLL